LSAWNHSYKMLLRCLRNGRHRDFL